MLTPAATAARIERLPEWKNVPSPMFWNMCGPVGEGARPIHWAPSPPMWEMLTALRSIHSDHGVAADTAADDRTVGQLVERLCGQPLQKNGLRATSGSCTEAAADSSRARRASSALDDNLAERRRASSGASRSAVSSPSAGTSRRPSASCLPTTRGRSASG